ncbi:MAG: AAA family ATPase [Aestuariivita sp.]|nr:AAA family ATPase [Aestuariivita sp.]MCY4204084.1 AAA family ATPase [Aestuariivita sp.]
MIYRIEIENFYSVRERQIIDLTVGKKVPEEPGRLVTLHDNTDLRAPRVAALYGANASGKSNILRAIAFLSYFIRFSFESPSGRGLPYLKFNTRDMVKKPTVLSISFAGFENPNSIGNSRTCPYVYRLELSPILDESNKVLRESLHYRPRASSRLVKILERDAEKNVKVASWVGVGRERSVLKRILRPDASVICTLAQLDNKLAQQFIKSAAAVYTNILIGRLESSDHDIAKEYRKDEKLLSKLNRDVQRLDLGVNKVFIETQRGPPKARFDHAGLDGPINMNLESHGTQQFVRIYPTLCRALEQGGIAIIDELDAAIHPTILPEILRWFCDNDRNPHGAQLWMSCHSVSLLDGLLKEEVLICEKSPSAATKVYKLAAIKGIRRSENYQRLYLGGVYGRVPIIG